MIEATENIIDTQKNVWRRSQVVEKVQSMHHVKVSDGFVSKVLRNCLEMRYRKVKRIPFQGNCDRCIIQRQQYAKFMLGVLESDRRVLNLDETWLNTTDFRPMKWRPRNDTNSLPSKGIAPRISVIAGIDTDGKVYFSLTQVNTNTDVFLLFLKRLCDKLTTEDKNWKQNTVMLVDGASYHSSDPVREFISKSKIMVILSSAYSYDGAPVEMFFHLLKMTNLNSKRLATGKK